MSLASVSPSPLLTAWQSGLTYRDFLARHANPAQAHRWQEQWSSLQLTAEQRTVLAGFRRQMPILVFAGAWCGDCAEQCPMFARIEEACPLIQFRYLDRDEHSAIAEPYQICGGRRVPTAVFLSEDGYFCGVYGDRTLSRYRELAAQLSGAACPIGLVPTGSRPQPPAVQEWLNEIERVQLMLQLSGRLRQLHGD